MLVEKARDELARVRAGNADAGAVDER